MTSPIFNTVFFRFYWHWYVVELKKNIRTGRLTFTFHQPWFFSPATPHHQLCLILQLCPTVIVLFFALPLSFSLRSYFFFAWSSHVFPFHKNSTFPILFILLSMVFCFSLPLLLSSVSPSLSFPLRLPVSSWPFPFFLSHLLFHPPSFYSTPVPSSPINLQFPHSVLSIILCTSLYLLSLSHYHCSHHHSFLFLLLSYSLFISSNFH